MINIENVNICVLWWKVYFKNRILLFVKILFLGKYISFDKYVDILLKDCIGFLKIVVIVINFVEVIFYNINFYFFLYIMWKIN